MEDYSKAYQVVNDTYYDLKTDPEVIRLLEMARAFGWYVWMRLGDRNTGRDWMDEYDVTGFISRSMGPIKIPILLPARSSRGGGGILDASIVRLIVYDAKRKRRHEWRHSLYQVPELARIHATDVEGYTTAVLKNCEIVARFKNAAKAQRWIDFITGRRLNK